MRCLLLLLMTGLALSAQDYAWLRVVPGSSYCPREVKDGERTVMPGRSPATREAWAVPDKDRAIPMQARTSGVAFGFTDVDNKLTTLEAFKGKVVVVAFFSTSCEPSLRMLLDVAQLQPKGAQYGFEIVPVHMESWINIGQMARKLKEVQNVRFYRAGLGEHGPMQLGPELAALPTVFILDRQGRVAHAYVGYAEQRLSQALRRYLAEKPQPDAPAEPPTPAGR